ARCSVGLKKRLDSPAQVRIAGAGLVQVGRPFDRVVALQRLEEDLPFAHGASLCIVGHVFSVPGYPGTSSTCPTVQGRSMVNRSDAAVQFLHSRGGVADWRTCPGVSAR